MPDIVRADNPLDISLSETELESRRDQITAFIEAQYNAAKADVAITGLSGGIDSTLVAYLAVEALGTENVYGLSMPSGVNLPENMSDAERVASELLDIEYDVVAIDRLVEAALEVSPGLSLADRNAEEHQLTVGNLRARVRAVLWYLEANRCQGIVLGGGNRSENAMGYFTKYGDAAADCRPLGTLYKAQVRQLARHVGVPDDFVGKPATAGLWEGQTDEAELGMGYDTLDSILVLHVDGTLSASATAREIGVYQAVVEGVRQVYESSAHKRRVPPSPERFSSDRHW